MENPCFLKADILWLYNKRDLKDSSLPLTHIILGQGLTPDFTLNEEFIKPDIQGVREQKGDRRYMRSTKIDIRFSRLGNAISGFVFGCVAYMFLDAAFLGNISIDIRPIWLWIFFLISGIVAFITIKNAVSPNLIFSADSWGLKIGRGVLFSKVHQLRWSELIGIEEAIIKISVQRSNRSNLIQELPAIKLVFHSSIDLGRLGYKMARPDKKSSYLIAAKLFRMPLPNAIEILREMKEQYS